MTDNAFVGSGQQFRDCKALSQHQCLDTGAMMARLGLIAEQPAATRQQ
jgi:hypothetical protein